MTTSLRRASRAFRRISRRRSRLPGEQPFVLSIPLTGWFGVESESSGGGW